MKARWHCRDGLLDIAEQHRETVLAVHTHTQPAQPTTVAHYLLAVIEQLERDAVRLRAAFVSTNRNPLGACAITGTGFPIDRALTSDLLGFDGPTGNTYGSIATVDYLLESASAASVALRRPWAVRPGPAALGHAGVRLRALRRRLRAVEQHHAAEAQPGRASSMRAPSAARRSGRRQAIVTAVHNTPFGDIVDTEDDLQPLVVVDVRRRHARVPPGRRGHPDRLLRCGPARGACRGRRHDDDGAGRYAGARAGPAVQDGAHDCRSWCSRPGSTTRRPTCLRSSPPSACRRLDGACRIPTRISSGSSARGTS